MEDKEIIKALECCTSGTTSECCNKCPFSPEDICDKDGNALEKYALALINRQKAEIERLNKENADREISYINLYNEMKDRLRESKEQTNMYKQFWLDSYNEGEMYEARADAVKEFCERTGIEYVENDI